MSDQPLLTDQEFDELDRFLMSAHCGDETMAMEWQAESGLWVKSLYLKQGFYDYRYLTGPEPCSAVLLEGSHADTENDYEVLVYYHPPAGMAYDRLVGYTKVNSMGQRGR